MKRARESLIFGVTLTYSYTQTNKHIHVRTACEHKDRVWVYAMNGELVIRYRWMVDLWLNVFSTISQGIVRNIEWESWSGVMEWRLGASYLKSLARHAARNSLSWIYTVCLSTKLWRHISRWYFYLWDRVWSIFRDSGNFCFAHWLTAHTTH